MLEDLREVLQGIENARPLIVCHPDDETSVRLAADAACIFAPNIRVDPHVKPGEALVFPGQAAE